MASPTRSPAPSKLTPEQLEAKRFDLVATSQFNKDVGRLIALLAKLQQRLEVFCAYDSADLARLWRDAGLPPLAEDDHVAFELLDVADDLPQDASGFLWALRAFLSTLNGNLIHHGRLGARG